MTDPTAILRATQPHSTQPHSARTRSTRTHSTRPRSADIRSTAIRLAALAVALGLLSACGRPGDPTLKPGQSDSYPRTYPKGAAGGPPNIFRSRGPGRGID